MADKVKVAINGYGTIGKRVASAVMRQDDMALIGVAKTKPDYDAYVAAKNGIDIYPVDPAKAESKFKAAGIKIAGSNEDMIKKADIIVDCTPGGIGEQNKPLYEKLGKKAIFQGGEEHELAGTSFNAVCNYDEAIGKQFVRVVSCNTTGLARLIYALDKGFGVKKVRATMMRRGGDPNDVKRGPINAIVPDPVKLPSHHGPDLNTVLPNIKIDTVAVKLPTTLMHMHYVNMNLKVTPSRDEVVSTLKQYPRLWLIPSWMNIKSTADVMEFGRELGRPRNDMMENCIWEESVSVDDSGEVNLFQAIHQESDAIPENVDCIRAMMGIEKDAKKSMDKTDKTLGLGNFAPWIQKLP
ncbi:type II glyceraldehyde-3-phosphate dehydrogenase [Methanocella sp. CWC-04]|uniref:Glyceraldehyde-3-phosphate dehydrogenase n=1 Tax=Methanooceanicella nereidis TaxID=2052831 RepID=A0AAP2W5T2_9EURY|nr:type II glyceraldehyde-3-phosphate dehydrogenase [Methanocella sp. CWC-04]MCD1294462.1 type II glyceraldehyde-3-phosphate dehydrogenase [Methanocella sp. CWC-04]